MGFWEILFIVLLGLALAFAVISLYRWRKYKKLVSRLEKLKGKKLDELVAAAFKNRQGSVPLNIPKKGTVVVFFKGANCKLCPKQEEELKKLPSKVKVLKFDVRTKKGKMNAAVFSVMVLPTVVVVKDRVIKDYFTTFVSAKKLEKSLKD